MITLGDQEIDLSPSFTIFLSTRDPSVEFPPDLCSRVTFVNFTVTRSSLQSQCLNRVRAASSFSSYSLLSTLPPSLSPFTHSLSPSLCFSLLPLLSLFILPPFLPSFSSLSLSLSLSHFLRFSSQRDLTLTRKDPTCLNYKVLL